MSSVSPADQPLTAGRLTRGCLGLIGFVVFIASAFPGAIFAYRSYAYVASDPATVTYGEPCYILVSQQTGSETDEYCTARWTDRSGQARTAKYRGVSVDDLGPRREVTVQARVWRSTLFPPGAHSRWEHLAGLAAPWTFLVTAVWLFGLPRRRRREQAAAP